MSGLWSGTTGFWSGSVGLGASFGSLSGGGGLSPESGETPFPPSIYPLDATTDDVTSSWHADVMARQSSVVICGYSKSGGVFGIMERDPATGAVGDARIILDKTQAPDIEYTGINDHFMVVTHIVQNGASAGQLWCITLPHGTNTAEPGNRRFYARYSPSGRTGNLLPCTGGVVPGDASVLQVGTTHNYGNVHERSDGRLTLLTIDDAATPAQAARILWTDSPATTPVQGRQIYNMTAGGGSFPAGGSPQLYTNSVPDLGAPNRAFDVMFLHPSVPDAPIKIAWRDLSAGTVLQNVDTTPTTAGTGTIYDASGSVMLAYGDAATASVSTGGRFTRVHDVLAWGDYQAHAIAITRGLQGTDQNAASHYVLWCDPADDRSDSANWQEAAPWALNRARTWDQPTSTTGSRRYNNDIRFLPPTAAHPCRVALIAWTGSTYVIEVWGGATPGTMSLVGTQATTDRPCRLFVSPGAATDALQCVAYGFQGTYTAFSNFTPMTPQTVLYTIPVAATAPAIVGTPQVGTPIVVTQGTYTGIPSASLSHVIERADTGAGPWTQVSATIAYTPVLADDGKVLRVVETASNSVGTAAPQNSAASAAVVSGFSPGTVPNSRFFVLDSNDATGSPIDTWNSDTASSGSDIRFTSSGSERPSFASSPSRIVFNNNSMQGTLAFGQDFYRNDTARYLRVKIRVTSVPASVNRWILAWTNNVTNVRFGILQTPTGALIISCRKLDGTGESSVTTSAVSTGVDTVIEARANFTAGGGTLDAWVDGFLQTGVSLVAAGTNGSNTASANFLMGSNLATSADFNGAILSVLGAALTTGNISDATRSDYNSWAAANLP